MSQAVRFTNEEKTAIEKVCKPLKWSSFVHNAVKEKLDQANNKGLDLSHASIERITAKIIEGQKR